MEDKLYVNKGTVGDVDSYNKGLQIKGAEKIVEMLKDDNCKCDAVRGIKPDYTCKSCEYYNRILAYFKDTLSSSEKIEGKCKECGKFTSTRLCGYCNAKNLSPAPQLCLDHSKDEECDNCKDDYLGTAQLSYCTCKCHKISEGKE